MNSVKSAEIFKLFYLFVKMKCMNKSKILLNLHNQEKHGMHS